MLGLYKCNYSLTRGKELYIRPFEGNLEVNVAPGENEFDTPGVQNAPADWRSKTAYLRRPSPLMYSSCSFSYLKMRHVNSSPSPVLCFQ